MSARVRETNSRLDGTSSRLDAFGMRQVETELDLP